MSVQNSYGIDHNKAYAGMVADQQLLNTVSRLNNTAAIIPYGRAVVTGSVEGAIKLPDNASTAAELNGVAMYELNRAYQDGEEIGAVVGQDTTVATVTCIWVEVVEAVVKDDPAFFVIGDGNPNTDLGKFSNVAGAALKAAVAIPAAKFVSAAAAGELAKVSISLGG